MLIARPHFVDFSSLDREIHVWTSHLDPCECAVERCYQLLPERDHARIKRYKTKQLRDRRAVSRASLMQLVGLYLEAHPTQLEFAANEFEKPFLQGYYSLKLHFNVSHSGPLGLYAFAENKLIGCDVEEILPLEDLDKVAENCLSKYEQEWFFALDPSIKLENFYRMWTIKEAYLKAIGTGLSMSPANIELEPFGEINLFRSLQGSREAAQDWQIFSYFAEPSFCAAVVTQSGPYSLQRFYWETNLPALAGAL